ncbi:hypothetical protein PCE1_004804 [Barthelona sp. PCE]
MSFALKLPLSGANLIKDTIKWLRDNQMWPKRAKVQKVDNGFVFPLLCTERRDAVNICTHFGVCELIEPNESLTTWESSQQKFSRYLDEHDVPPIKMKIDRYGDIAVVFIPTDKQIHKNIYGNAFLHVFSDFDRVCIKSVQCDGTFRAAQYEIIAKRDGAPNDLCSIYTESGTRLHIDLNKFFFSSRLASERKRLRNAIQEEESVLVMFAGSGPFGTVIARENPFVKRLTMIEMNPECENYIEKNINENNLENVVDFFIGDVNVVLPELDGIYNRFVLPCPRIAIDYVPLLIENQRIFADNCFLHLYVFCSEEELQSHIIRAISMLEGALMDILKVESHKSGSQNASTIRFCIDIEFKRTD